MALLKQQFYIPHLIPPGLNTFKHTVFICHYFIRPAVSSYGNRAAYVRPEDFRPCPFISLKGVLMRMAEGIPSARAYDRNLRGDSINEAFRT